MITLSVNSYKRPTWRKQLEASSPMCYQFRKGHLKMKKTWVVQTERGLAGRLGFEPR
jgi:hypothetical protein